MACKKSKIETPTQNKIETVNDAIVVQEDASTDYLKRVKPSNGKFLFADLTNEFCLVFGLGNHEPISAWENINSDSLKRYIIDPTYEEFSNLREMRVHRVQKDSLPICTFGNSLLIPFSSNENYRHLTLWEKISHDSVEFVRIVEPPIGVNYSNIAAINFTELKSENYLLL